jgi:hypothetical protein
MIERDFGLHPDPQPQPQRSSENEEAAVGREVAQVEPPETALVAKTDKAQQEKDEKLLKAALGKGFLGTSVASEDMCANMHKCLKNGANANALDENGNNALMLALKHGNVRYGGFYEMFLSYGIDLNHQNETGSTILHLVCAQTYSERTLHTNNSEYDLKTYSTAPQVAKILAHDVDVNIQNIRGKTPLMFAAEFGDVDIVYRLLDAGADISLKDERGLTAYDYAMKSDGIACARALKDFSASKIGASQLPQDTTGETQQPEAVTVDQAAPQSGWSTNGVDLASYTSVDEQGGYSIRHVFSKATGMVMTTMTDLHSRQIVKMDVASAEDFDESAACYDPQFIQTARQKLGMS